MSFMKKPKYNSRSLARYVNSLQQDSKEAYDIFREQAVKSGLYKSPEPLPKIHLSYYDKYIKGIGCYGATPMGTERSQSQVGSAAVS